MPNPADAMLDVDFCDTDVEFIQLNFHLGKLLSDSVWEESKVTNIGTNVSIAQPVTVLKRECFKAATS